MMRLKASETKEYRHRLWVAQGHRCALSGYEISFADAVLDHDHATGRVRGVLHRGVNAMLGKIENSYKRYGVSHPMMVAACKNVGYYLSQNNGDKPYYHTHRTEEEKRERRNKLARQRRAKAKAAS